MAEQKSRSFLSGALAWLRAPVERLRARAPWTLRPAFLMTAFAALAFAGFAGLAVGYVAAKRAIPYYIRIGYVEPAAHAVRAWLGIPESVRWRDVQTHAGAVETAAIPITPTGAPFPAAVEDLDGNLVVVTMAGAFFYLMPSFELRSLDIDTPMNREGLGELAGEWEFSSEFFRTHDLLAIPAGPRTFDLYASYDRYTGQCFEVAVSRIRLATSEAGVRAESGWEDVFVAAPCLPPRDERGLAFRGIQVAGRLARRDADTILLSLGDVERDGSNGRPDLAQDPQSDFGKLIAISLSDGSSERFARGFRNPQGLLVDSQGRIWESEHGPVGGDEVNLVRPGANYGWPLVTYGLPYTQPPSPHTRFGVHDGYERPAIVFTPAIGPSQMVEPSVEQFPFWRSSILLASLRNESIYVLRLDGEEVVYAEPFFLDGRVRDIISRPNGEIAMLTEEHGGGGHLLLMRAKREERAAERFQVADLRARGGRPAGEATLASRATPADRGRALFQQSCASCHGGEGGAGPPLAGVIGRDIAAVEGFSYSAALSGARGQWTAARLRRFLVDPNADFAGSTMPAVGLAPDQANEVVAYLRTTE